MPALIALFGANWRALAASAAFIAALAYGAILIHQRNSARAQAAAFEAEVASARAAVSECHDAVARQNAAVAAIQVAARRAVDAAGTREANVAARASAEAERASQRAVALAHAPVAPGCAAAIRWGNGEAQELGRW